MNSCILSIEKAIAFSYIEKYDHFPRDQENQRSLSRNKRQKLPIIKKQLLIDTFFSRWVTR